MAKPWSERPLWEKCWLGPHATIYQEAGKIIGHKTVNAFAFYDDAKKLPCYVQYQFENAVRDLCGYQAREKGEYALTAQAKKILRILIGPCPDAPDYVSWWTARMVSVRLERAEGREPSHAAEPPVPIMDLEIPARGGKEEPKVEPAKGARKRPRTKKAKT